jgi:hypothetical protein
MNTLGFVSIMSLILQVSPGAGLAPLVGRWVSTVVPKAGEAPVIPPSFSIDASGGQVKVSIQGGTEPYVAKVFNGTGGEVLLMFKSPAPKSGVQTVIVRPLSSTEVRLELFTEFPEGSRDSSYYYAEVFKKATGAREWF